MDGRVAGELPDLEAGLALVEARALTRAALLSAFRPALAGIRVFAVADLGDLGRLPDLRLRAAVLCLDGRLSGEAARLMIAQARARLGSAPIIVLADEGEDGLPDLAFESGANAYLTTSTPLDLAAATMRLVVAGKMASHSGDHASQSRASDAANGAIRPETGKLTAREEDVLRLVGEGAQNKMIAYRLNMSENTVKVHLHRILQKFRLHNRTEAALAAPGYFASSSGDGAARHPDLADHSPE